MSGHDASADWRWSSSEVECYRDLAQHRNEARRAGRGDIYAVFCVERTWKNP